MYNLRRDTCRRQRFSQRSLPLLRLVLYRGSCERSRFAGRGARTIRQLTALANEAPDRFEVWWGLARYYTSDFSTTVFTDSGYKKASLAIENACRTSSAANRAKIEAVWKRYTADYLKDRSKKQNQVRPLHQLLAV